MADENTVRLDTTMLSNITRMFKQRLPIVRIGVLGNDAVREGSGPNNAEVGAAHEFGSAQLPRRSFLRIPLQDHLNEYLTKSGYAKDTIKKVLAMGSIKPFMEKIAAAAEAVVLDGFKSRGFGKWRAWSKGYSNKTGTVLVDTTQLRDSITTVIKE